VRGCSVQLMCEVLSGTMGLAGAEVPFGAAFEDVSAFEEALWVDVIFVLTTRRFFGYSSGSGDALLLFRAGGL